MTRTSEDRTGWTVGLTTIDPSTGHINEPMDAAYRRVPFNPAGDTVFPKARVSYDAWGAFLMDTEGRIRAFARAYEVDG